MKNGYPGIKSIVENFITYVIEKQDVILHHIYYFDFHLLIHYFFSNKFNSTNLQNKQFNHLSIYRKESEIGSLELNIF